MENGVWTGGKLQLRPFLNLALMDFTVSFLHRPLRPEEKIAVLIEKGAGLAGEPCRLFFEQVSVLL